MRIVIASNNLKKAEELSNILAQKKITPFLQSKFNIPSVQETGLTFVENAILKARNAAAKTGLPTIGDDSGIEVAALAKAPGIYSARFAGINASDQENINKLLFAMRNIPAEQRQATFQCLIVFLTSCDDPTPIICQGSWHGFITDKPRGSGGFGYDPIFWVPEYSCTAAELSNEVKNNISHRALALKKLLRKLPDE